MLAADPPVFDLIAAPEHPVPLFVEWLCHAIDSGVPEPHAMTLSTIGSGRPSARVLILKDVTAGDAGWHFASSAASPKGVQLRANPVAALTFYWPTLGRQIRVEGAVTVDPSEVALADFLARSPEARAHLDSDDWRSWAVRADAVEFWQADPGRRHLRLRYTRSAAWTRELLRP
ncbi:pyridoxal 5'-phosphate synthase [soil metagenome]